MVACSWLDTTESPCVKKEDTKCVITLAVRPRCIESCVQLIGHIAVILQRQIHMAALHGGVWRVRLLSW
jgi:hypothetical protein